MAKGRVSDSDLLRQHQAGASYTALAERYGLSRDSVRGRIWRAKQAASDEPVIRAAPLTADDDLPPVPDDLPEIKQRLAALERLPRMARVLVLSDEHLPDHDPRALAMNVSICRWFQPDILVFNGDTFDLSLIGKFMQDRRGGKPDVLKEVARPYRGYAKALAEAAPHALRIFLDGNHNARVEAFANLAWQFGDVIEEAYAAVVRCDGLVLWANGRDEIDIGPFLVHHGTRTGVNAAKLSLEKDYAYGQSVVQGHSHGIGFFARRVRMPGGRYRIATSVEAGFAGNNPPAYISRRSAHTTWVQACVYAHVDLTGDMVHTYPVLYQEGGDGSLVAAVGSQVFEVKLLPDQSGSL